ncbi:Mitochondrial matrix iron chaperone [Dispira parvispora]|uniref:ferroxidase n=1 Tax=Dispira parvispora TaxID=1520584 RepID=A0A9W8AWD5_9FUNG|nr:Mitochondrial matrix iron chaperone [Dispira parvispora]
MGSSSTVTTQPLAGFPSPFLNRFIRTFYPQRIYSSQRRLFTAAQLSDTQYHDVAQTTMNHLVDQLEVLGEEIELPEYDVEYASGVLTLTLGHHGTYVINKQPPNKQIWLSSPFSGPKRYDYDTAHAVWFYQRDGTTLGDLLNQELETIFHRPVEVL